MTRCMIAFLLAVRLVAVGYASTHKGPIIQGQDLFTKKPIQVSFESVKKASVVVFLSAKCPCSRKHQEVLNDLYTKYNGKEFQFFAVHSNADESEEMTKKHFKEFPLPEGFKIIQDPESKIADLPEIRALKTPHVFVFDTKGEAVFKGSITDRRDPAEAKRHYLKAVLEAIRNGKEPEFKNVDSLGCKIARP